MSFIEKIFGDLNKREVKKVNKIVDKIVLLEEETAELSDDELKAKTQEFRNRLAKGETLDDILPEAFAACREAAWRSVGMKPFRVQLIGGVVLHQGRIAEMKTGEGKTLMATLPVYLNALSGKGVHVVTVNDYLAKRDSEWMGKVYSYMGLSVGCIVHGITEEERRAAYEADITYGTNNEFGFDYLRDNMVTYEEELMQRELNFAIVDEVDSILIDEARTPLIISGQGTKSTDLYKKADSFVKGLTKGKDFEIEEKDEQISLTDEGVVKAEDYFELENFGDPENMEVNHHVQQALKAHNMMEKDVDYIVKDGEIIIVDEFTGRLMFGRRYSNGLHQAIEAKERLKVRSESKTLATVTLQNLFRMYNKLAGMTGTAKTEEDEFREIYNMDVVVIPTNKDVIRNDMQDVVYQKENGKFKAIAEKVAEIHATGQPVLVGTISIEKSELISDLLRKKGVSHNVLNAKQHEKEAEIVAEAGRLGMVTIATNMAGRGTDIKLGGDPDSFASKVAEKGTEEYDEIFKVYQRDCEENKEKVIKAGGLFILGTERHESRRIDNQLRGRAGRQGDPGTSEFYLSLDDDLMRLFGGDKLKSMMKVLNIGEYEEIRHKQISKQIENAQKRIESRNFSSRKSLIEYDDVNNTQREVIYTQRDAVLSNENLKELIFDMIRETVEDTVEMSLSGDSKSDWDFNLLKDKLNEIFEYDMDKSLESKSKDEIIDQVYEDLIKRYNEKEEITGEEVFRRIERYIMLEVLDQKWRQHLKDLTELREGIRLRSYGQRNPIHDYKIVAFEIYNEMIDAIKRETGSFLLKLKLRNEEETTNLKHEEAKNLKYEHTEEEVEDAETAEETPHRKLSRRERREMERKK